MNINSQSIVIIITNNKLSIIKKLYYNNLTLSIVHVNIQ